MCFVMAIDKGFSPYFVISDVRRDTAVLLSKDRNANNATAAAGIRPYIHILYRVCSLSGFQRLDAAD